MTEKLEQQKNLDELIEDCFIADFSDIKLSELEKKQMKLKLPKKWWQKTIEISWGKALAACVVGVVLYGYVLAQLVWVSPQDLEANKLNEFYIEQKIGEQVVRISLNSHGR
ncbi:MAG: hypothetical protein JM58_09040 [Peptococcaceae bacterium BICA1-8]|nr:MAG: hypothetical protein JM58_09040 [Peptococcaceae bacterium BICA1-8]